MVRQLKNTKMFLITALSFIVFGCGAPTKKASEVGNIFADADSLQEKTDSACDILKSRDESPSQKDLKFNPDCGSAGLKALNLKEIDAFYFSGLEGNPPKDEKIVRKNIRTQVWLNKSLLGLATMVGKKLAANQNIDLGKLDIAPSGIGKDFSKLFKLDIEVTKKPTLDTKDLSFSMALTVKGTGVATIENDIIIAGRLVRENNTFLVTIKSSKDQSFEKSLLQNFSGMVLIVPYAGAVYLDMILDMNIHNIGFNGAIDSQLNPVLGSALKKGIDGFLN